jgi:histidyl-tRNA synthetase
MQALVEGAPRLMDFLGPESVAHLDRVRAVLDAAGLPYRINPRLVRGLDYYNLTVFEWVTDRLGAQNTVCGGGRYDPLVERLGGKPAPAVGWGMGIERVLLLLKELQIEAPPASPLVYAVVPDAAAAAAALPACDALRGSGVSVLMHAGGADGWGSMKAQLRRADASGARYALIFGADELARGEVALKALRDAGAAQRSLPLAAIAAWGAGLGAA